MYIGMVCKVLSYCETTQDTYICVLIVVRAFMIRIILSANRGYAHILTFLVARALSSEKPERKS